MGQGVHCGLISHQSITISKSLLRSPTSRAAANLRKQPKAKKGKSYNFFPLVKAKNKKGKKQEMIREDVHSF